MNIYKDIKIYVNQKMITDYISFIWTDRYNSCGDFELLVPFNSENSAFYKEDMIVTCSLSNKVMLIEEIKISITDENGRLMKISGRSYESIFDRRVVAFTEIYSDTDFYDDKFIRAFSLIISSCCGGDHMTASQYLTPYKTNPHTNSYKNVYTSEWERELGINNAAILYDPKNHISEAHINIDATGKSVLELLETHCKNKDFGFLYNGGSSVYIYDGYDRSNEIEFSFENGNLASFDYISNKKDYKNAVYVQGEEYQSRENIVEVNGISYVIDKLEKEGKMAILNPDANGDNPIFYRTLSKIKGYSGLDRREFYIESSKSRGQNTDLKYGARLRAEGNYELLQKGIVLQASGEIIHDQRLTYGEDYYLGDIVSLNVGNKLEIYDMSGNKQSLNIIKMQISEVTISHSESGLDIFPVLSIYDPNKYKNSNYTDQGYDPTEDSDEISNLNYDKVVEVDFMFNGGHLEYQNVVYTEWGNTSPTQSADNSQWYVLPKMAPGVVSFKTDMIIGYYNYQARGDYLITPQINLIRDHYIFVRWEKDETYAIPSDGPNPMTINAIWKPVIHYIIWDPGDEGSYSSNKADRVGNESVFLEWKKNIEESENPKIHSSFLIKDPNSLYNGCIAVSYVWNEFPKAITPSYQSSKTITGSDGEKHTLRIIFDGWNPSPITRVEEKEKRYTAVYILEDTNTPDPPKNPDDKDHYSPDGTENGIDPLKEKINMLHFTSCGTNIGCEFRPIPDSDLMEKISNGGKPAYYYNTAFKMDFIDPDDESKILKDFELCFRAYCFCAQGEIHKPGENQVEYVYRNWAKFPCGISITSKDRNKNDIVLYQMTLREISRDCKITELAFSDKPLILPHYQNIKLSNIFPDIPVGSFISFIPYSYGTSDSDIYQRPPSNWKTSWNNYYKVNEVNGGEIGFCINYYDAFGNRIDEKWSADGGTRDDQPAKAKTVNIDGKVYYPQYSVNYGKYYNGGWKIGANTIYPPYSKIAYNTSDAGSSADAWDYWTDSGWRFIPITNPYNGSDLKANKTTWDCGKTFWENTLWVTVHADKIFGPGYFSYKDINPPSPPATDPKYSNGDLFVHNNYAQGNTYLYGWGPGGSDPDRKTNDALTKMAGNAKIQIKIIKKTKNCICTSTSKAMFVCWAIAPGYDIKAQWQVQCGFNSDGSENWQDIPDATTSVLWVACTPKSHSELANMGYEGIYSFLGTNNSNYRCLITYEDEPYEEQRLIQENENNNSSGTKEPEDQSYKIKNKPSLYIPKSDTGLQMYVSPSGTIYYINPNTNPSQISSLNLKSYYDLYDRSGNPLNSDNNVKDDDGPKYETVTITTREIEGTRGSIIIDDSPYPEGVIIEDNPDIGEDDNPKDNGEELKKGRGVYDLDRRTRQDITNSILSMNGGLSSSKPEKGSFNYQYTLSRISVDYDLSESTAEELIDKAYSGNAWD